MKIKHVGVLSLVRIAAVSYAVVGLCVGGLISLGSVLGMFPKEAAGDSESAAVLAFGAAAVVILPFLYAAIGSAAVAIAAWIYNVLAGRLGGVEIELE